MLRILNVPSPVEVIGTQKLRIEELQHEVDTMKELLQKKNMFIDRQQQEIHRLEHRLTMIQNRLEGMVIAYV
jgi:predicted  nucleic acid-binding Zn-ribbon protein